MPGTQNYLLDIHRDKYYDWARQKIIDENDICEYSTWVKPGEYSCTLHQKGFKIFIPKIDIDINDEYAVDDPYSVDLDDSAFHKARVESTLYLIGSIFGKDDRFRLLDVGCGRGYITDQICKTFPHSELSALDYSVSAIDFAIENFKKIDFIVADAYNLPYTEGYFNIIICNNIWEHVPDPLNILKSIKRSLKQGGYLLISTPSRYRISSLIRILMRKPIQLISKMHITEYSIGQLKEQLKYGGFETVKIYGKKNYKIIGIKQWVIYCIIKPFLKLLLTCIRLSPYMLESTVYILAKKEKYVSVK